MALPFAACGDTEILSVAATVGANTAPGETSDVYARIARQAKACWFRPNGLIKKNHMFFASADPQAQGGKVEISIRRRTKKGKPGAKSFIIGLVPAGANTLYSTRNIDLDKKTSSRLSRDVRRWANLELGCNAATQKRWKPELPAVSAR